jgi:hypothetical protein
MTMMNRVYAAFGALVLGAFFWVHFTGWGFGDVDEVKGVPKSIRDNPGSYRSSYGWARTHTGGK